MTPDIHEFMTVLAVSLAALFLSWNARRIATGKQAKAIQRIAFDLEWLCQTLCEKERQAQLAKQDKAKRPVQLSEYRRVDERPPSA